MGLDFGVVVPDPIDTAAELKQVIELKKRQLETVEEGAGYI